MEDIEEMDVWCKEDTGMQKKLGGDMSGRTRHTTLERKGKHVSQQQKNTYTSETNILNAEEPWWGYVRKDMTHHTLLLAHQIYLNEHKEDTSKKV